MTLAVLIHEDENHIEQIHLDIEPTKNEIFKLLSGRATFIGQWPDIDVVIMKPEVGLIKNDNILPEPFHEEEIAGKILLVRMDENSDPQDFMLDEYMSLLRGDKRIPC